MDIKEKRKQYYNDNKERMKELLTIMLGGSQALRLVKT